MNSLTKFDHPRQRTEGQGFNGWTVDVDETRRKNDGRVHIHQPEITEGGGK